MKAVAWTAWRPLRLADPVPAQTLREQLDGGQAFRWNTAEDGVWTGVFGRTVAGVRAGSNGLEWRGVVGVSTTEAALQSYLDAAGGQAGFVETLPWRSDVVLRAAIAANPGLRILRQDRMTPSSAFFVVPINVSCRFVRWSHSWRPPSVNRWAAVFMPCRRGRSWRPRRTVN